MKNFTPKQSILLNEIHRRLNFFHGYDLDAKLLFLETPSYAKPIKELGLIKPYDGRERPRQLNSYNLTQKGKDFFKNYVDYKKMSAEENINFWTGNKRIQFDKNLIK